MSTETRLRERMTAYTESVTPTGPDLPAAARTARRQRRIRVGGLAVVTVAVVAVAAVGVGVAASRRTDRIQPAVPPTSARLVPTPAPVPAGAPLPGFARVTQVTVPQALGVYASAEADGQTWAIASDPADNEPVLLHASDGQTLQVVHRYPYADVSDERFAIRDGHVVVVSTENDVSGSPKQDAELTVYDARTAAVVRTEDLTTAYGVAGAALVVADGGSGPLTVVLVGPGGADGMQQVRAGAVAPDGGISALTPPVELAASPFTVSAAPYPTTFSELQLVLSRQGAPRYLILAGQAVSVRRLDLLTGVVSTVVVDPTAPADGTGLQAVGIGVLDGRVLYASAAGLATGAVTADRAVQLPADGRPSAAQTVLVAGRAYALREGSSLQSAQALRPGTSQPYGPIATSALDATLDVAGGVVLVQRPASAAGTGGTLAAYAP